MYHPVREQVDDGHEFMSCTTPAASRRAPIDSSFTALGPWCGYTAEQRYARSYERQSNEWKSGSDDPQLKEIVQMSDGLATARSQGLPTSGRAGRAAGGGMVLGVELDTGMGSTWTGIQRTASIGIRQVSVWPIRAKTIHCCRHETIQAVAAHVDQVCVGVRRLANRSPVVS